MHEFKEGQLVTWADGVYGQLGSWKTDIAPPPWRYRYDQAPTGWRGYVCSDDWLKPYAPPVLQSREELEALYAE